MAIQTIEDLTPDPRNARRHTPRNIGVIERSLNEVGAARSIVIDEDGVILAGNATTEAAQQAGITRVRVIEADGNELIAVQRRGLTPEQKVKLALADNRAAELAEWEPDVLAGIAAEMDLKDLFHPDELAALAQPDAAPEAGAGGDEFDTTPDEGPTRAQSGDLWSIGGVHRLIVGDCTDAAVVARLMGGALADCVFTSPPYAVGVDYGEYQDTIDNLRAMLPKLSKRWLDVVVDGGYAVINFGDIASGRNIAESEAPCEYPMAVEYWPVFRADGWLLWSRRVWCKPSARVNSLWCIGSNRAATDWEHLWTWRKPGKPIIERVDGEMRSALGWYQSSLMNGVDVGKEIHGAGMALGIVEWMLNIHSRPGKIVYEPFCGTGTTIIGGHRLGRVVYASELSPKFADVILRRAEAEGLTVELVPSS